MGQVISLSIRLNIWWNYNNVIEILIINSRERVIIKVGIRLEDWDLGMYAHFKYSRWKSLILNNYIWFD